MHTIGATKRYEVKQTKQFSKSKVGNLFRHRGGHYYAVTKVLGKVRRKSLDTEDFNVAKSRLEAALNDLRGATASGTAGTLSEALRAEAARPDPEIKETTQHYYQQVAESLLETSNQLAAKPADKLITRATVADLRGWMDKHATRASVTRYNGAIALLRRVYARGIEADQLTRNLATEIKRLRPKSTKRNLPTVEDFARIVDEIATQKKRASKSAAAAVRLLASTGLRISEAQGLRWGDIEKDALVVRTAKNDDLRRLPLTKSAKTVLRELRKVLPSSPADPVMPIKSPRLALENACERLKLPHLRVHDLRHIFATRCIEAGVDLPTIASWLGLKDGGVLAAKTYGHLVEQHSAKQIKRVAI